MRKLKSSIKSLQETITRFKQAGPFCVHEAKTHSFRAGEVLCSSASHVQLTPSSSSHLQVEPAVRMRALPSSSSSSTSSCSSSSQPAQGRISSKRFFFSPSNTNSIMEAQVKTSDKDVAVGVCGFYGESDVMEMVSLDPYGDFKLSMAEMVEAHEIREWLNLQQLLHFYLSLNDGKNHKFIVLAFVDLVMQLVAEDREIFAFSAADPFCLCACDLLRTR